jgi:hypothetical protein
MSREGFIGAATAFCVLFVVAKMALLDADGGRSVCQVESCSGVAVRIEETCWLCGMEGKFKFRFVGEKGMDGYKENGRVGARDRRWCL